MRLPTRWTKKSQAFSNIKGTPSSSSKLDFGWVSAFSLVITLLAALLFGAGRAYRYSFLTRFGFDDWVMPWSFQDLVYLGTTKQALVLMAAIAGAFIGTVAIVVFTAALSWVGKKVRVRVARRPERPSKNKKAKGLIDDQMLDTAQILLNCFGAVLVFSYLALLFVAWAEAVGRKDAEQEIQAIKAAGTDGQNIRLRYAILERRVGDQVVTERGYVVTCTEKACGLFAPDKDKEAARIVLLDNLVSMRYVANQRTSRE